MSDKRKGRGYTKHIYSDQQPLGYVIMGGSRGGPATVWPIFRGDVEVKTTHRGKPITVWLSTYEQGRPLNGRSYPEDFEGCVLANIASQAIDALQNRAHTRELATETKKKTR